MPEITMPLVGHAAVTVARKIAVLYTRGVNVVLGAMGPKTDGDTIWLPDLTDLESPVLANRMIVSSTHEIGHCRFSKELLARDTARLKENKEAPYFKEYGVPAWHSKLAHSCINVAEDVRIERLMLAEYPGLIPDYFADYSDLTSTVIAKRMVTPGVPVTKKLLDSLFLRASSVEYEGAHLGALPTLDLGTPEESTLLEALAERFIPLLTHTVTDLDAEHVGLEMYHMLVDLSREPPGPPPPPPEGGGGGKGGKGDEKEEGEPEGCEGATPGERPPPPPPGAAAPPRLTERSLTEDTSALSEERREEMERAAGDLVGYAVAPGVTDEWMRTPITPSNVIAGKAVMDAGLRLLGGSAQRLRGLFVAQHSMVVRGSQVKGKHLDTGKIIRTLTTPPWQKPRIWESRIQGAAVDAAVSILGDESGSMGGGPGSMLNLAAQIIAGIAVTLERARIPLEIIGYSAYGASSSCTLRTNPAVFNLIKAFEEPRICLSRLVPHHGSNNSDPDALRLAGERLLSRREPKKVLLFMSDGEPYNGKVTAAARLAFKNELVLLGRHGVTVFGFGMGADLTQYFTNPNQHVSVSIGALRDLPRIMLKKLESILL